MATTTTTARSPGAPSQPYQTALSRIVQGWNHQATLVQRHQTGQLLDKALKSAPASRPRTEILLQVAQAITSQQQLPRPVNASYLSRLYLFGSEWSAKEAAMLQRSGASWRWVFRLVPYRHQARQAGITQPGRRAVRSPAVIGDSLNKLLSQLAQIQHPRRGQADAVIRGWLDRHPQWQRPHRKVGKRSLQAAFGHLDGLERLLGIAGGLVQPALMPAEVKQGRGMLQGLRQMLDKLKPLDPGLERGNAI